MKHRAKCKFPSLFYFIYFFVSIVFSEFVVRIFSNSGDGFPIFMILFALCFALFLGIICTALTEKAGRIVAYIAAVIILLITGTQLVYHHIYGSFLSVAQLGMGADAITNFSGAALIGIRDSLLGIVLLLLPVAALPILKIFKIPKRIERATLIPIAITVLIIAAVHLLAVFVFLPLGGMGDYSPYDIYNNYFVLGKSENHFGTLTTLRLEMKTIIFGTKETSKIDPVVIPDDLDDDEDEDNTDIPEPVVYGDNVTDIDFAKLSENETNKRLKALHDYFAIQEPTKQNEYTGKFKDYNVIEFCCESFSPYFISEELTPTLYKLTTSGIVCDNYYNTVCDNTSNGEYALCVGLLPDTSLLKKGWSSFYNFNSFTAAKKNYLKFCLGNQLKSIGYKTYAIHYYHGYYYKRNDTHPNMGYTFITQEKVVPKVAEEEGKVLPSVLKNGLEKTQDFPSSDLSMLEQTLPMLLEKGENGERVPFHAYYLTFSGHMPYNFKASTAGAFSYNAMALKNKEIIDSLDYPTAVKAYVGAQLELEAALKYTYDTLEEAGELDKTLIIMTADHYPYNLGLEKLSVLAGEELDPEFGKFKSKLVMWSGSIEEPIHIDKPCCTLDILPTVSNLLGLEFDSRLLMGTDMLSDGNHVAILGDRSFVTDKIMYNCETGKYTLTSDEEVDDEYVDTWVSYVKNKFTVSSEMLYTDYYEAIYKTSEE